MFTLSVDLLNLFVKQSLFWLESLVTAFEEERVWRVLFPLHLFDIYCPNYRPQLLITIINNNNISICGFEKKKHYKSWKIKTLHRKSIVW